MNGCPSPETEGSSLPVWRIADWLEHIDPGTHRRIKGLRLVTAYGIAALLGRLPEFSRGLSNGAWLSFLAAGFALWASVSEARTTRAESSRDLLVLCAAAALGAVSMIVLSPVLSGPGRPGAELTLVSGAFLVGYLRRFGVLGTGVGSQIFIGQLLAYGAQLVNSDLWSVGLAAVIAAAGAVVPRVLSGPAEHPALRALGKRCSAQGSVRRRRWWCYRFALDSHRLDGSRRIRDSWGSQPPSCRERLVRVSPAEYP
jgi:hypothetical protein